MQEKRFHAGYELLDTMQVQNSFGRMVGIVLGHKENAPCPYVTWECNSNFDSFITGHYFTTKEAAMKDFFERGYKTAELDLKGQYRKEFLIEDLKEAVSLGYGSEMVANLVKTEGFLRSILDKYEDLEHSSKSEWLLENIETLYTGMVKDHELFDLNMLDFIDQKDVTVLGSFGCVNGIVSVDKKDSPTCFYVNGIKNGKEKEGFIECRIGEIETILCDGRLLFDKEKEAIVKKETLDEKILGIKASQVEHPVGEHVKDQLNFERN